MLGRVDEDLQSCWGEWMRIYSLVGESGRGSCWIDGTVLGGSTDLLEKGDKDLQSCWAEWTRMYRLFLAEWARTYSLVGER